VSNHLRRVWRYYDRTESRIGYRWLLGGTKHFGWYEPGQSRWRLAAAMRRMEKVLADRLSLPPGSAVLDAGCGVGDVARAVAHLGGHAVTGVDILDFNLREATGRSAAAQPGGRTRFLLADYHHLPFADASFDGAYTMETLVHSDDPEAVLREFRRVLRPGGKLVMVEYSRTPREQVSERADRALTRVCEMAAMPGWLRLNHGDLEELARNAGFAVDPAEDVTARMLPMLRVFSLVGRLPYAMGRVVRRIPKVVNAMSGVELYRHRDAWRYQIYTAHRR
jgi:sterol 24-C-methyltransferase